MRRHASLNGDNIFKKRCPLWSEFYCLSVLLSVSPIVYVRKWYHLQRTRRSATLVWCHNENKKKLNSILKSHFLQPFNLWCKKKITDSNTNFSKKQENTPHLECYSGNLEIGRHCMGVFTSLSLMCCCNSDIFPSSFMVNEVSVESLLCQITWQEKMVKHTYFYENVVDYIWYYFNNLLLVRDKIWIYVCIYNIIFP